MRWLLALVALTATPAVAQVVTYPPPVAATPSQVQTAQSKADQAAADAAAAKVLAGQAMAAVPVPATSMPPMENVNGSVGTAGVYRPWDAVQPRITRAGMASTTTNTGDWAITWSKPLPTVPVVLPIPINATPQPVVCNVSTATVLGATGRCWMARSLPATLTLVTNLISYDVFGNPATGISVQIFAIPPTQ